MPGASHSRHTSKRAETNGLGHADPLLARRRQLGSKTQPLDDLPLTSNPFIMWPPRPDRQGDVHGNDGRARQVLDALARWPILQSKGVPRSSRPAPRSGVTGSPRSVRVFPGRGREGGQMWSRPAPGHVHGSRQQNHAPMCSCWFPSWPPRGMFLHCSFGKRLNKGPAW